MARKSQPLPSSVRRRYATIAETADYMRVAERTVRLMIEQGRLRAYRAGPRIVRLDLNEVDDAMVAYAGDTPAPDSTTLGQDRAV